MAGEASSAHTSRPAAARGSARRPLPAAQLEHRRPVAPAAGSASATDVRDRGRHVRHLAIPVVVHVGEALAVGRWSVALHSAIGATTGERRGPGGPMGNDGGNGGRRPPGPAAGPYPVAAGRARGARPPDRHRRARASPAAGAPRRRRRARPACPQVALRPMTLADILDGGFSILKARPALAHARGVRGHPRPALRRVRQPQPVAPAWSTTPGFGADPALPRRLTPRAAAWGPVPWR